MDIFRWLFYGIKSRLPKTSKQFIKDLVQAGAKIGEGTVFFSPGTNYIDFGKAFLIRIGKYCKITQGVVILAHDYSRSVARMKFGENIGGSSPVLIGDNVFIGMNSIILKGTVIGDNCIIGAGAVVSGKFPSNSVIAGNPAKVISSLEDYYEKRKEKVVMEACECVRAIYENTGEYPTVKQMGDGFAWLYLQRSKRTLSDYPGFFDLSGDDSKSIVEDFMKSKPLFDSFESFLEYAKERIREGNKYEK